ncbi:MAG: hypothetical protein ABH843_07365 [Candidatus Omnitrophota bacterium]
MRSLFFGFVAAILICSFAYAAPVGNPTEPAYLKGNNRGKLTGIFNVLLGRDLENDAKIDSGTEYTAKLAYNFKEKIEVYALVGAANDVVVTSDTEFIPGSSTEIELGMAGLVGCGATFVIHEMDYHYKPLRFGADVKVQGYTPEFDNLTLNGVNTTYTADKSSMLEWQVAIGAAYYYDRFIPYAGIKVSDITIKNEASVNNTSRSNTLNADNMFGIYGGCDFIYNDNVKFNIEGRVIDENAFNVGATIMY